MKERIKILDGFRAIAILPVMFFHFFTRWTDLYPYGDRFDYFEAGRLGVHLFFIISGFVIIYSLENTKSLKEFWIKRFIRLYPTMVICSLVSFLFITVFDFNKSMGIYSKPQNLLCSVTFLTPWNLKTLTGDRLEFQYVDGAYWSIWYEVLFYLFCSFLFFYSRKRFFANFVVLSFALILTGNFLDDIADGETFGLHINPNLLPFKILTAFFRIFWMHKYLVFFQLGFFFYYLFKARNGNAKLSRFFYPAFIFSGILFFYYAEVQFIPAFVFMIALFGIFVYFPQRLRFLEAPVIVSIGFCSYALYLLHQNIGVVILNDIKQYPVFNTLLTPLALIALFIWLSILFTNRVDKPIANYLRQVFKIKKTTADNSMEIVDTAEETTLKKLA